MERYLELVWLSVNTVQDNNQESLSGSFYQYNGQRWVAIFPNLLIKA